MLAFHLNRTQKKSSKPSLAKILHDINSNITERPPNSLSYQMYAFKWFEQGRKRRVAC